jgi:hypothetical protein
MDVHITNLARKMSKVITAILQVIPLLITYPICKLKNGNVCRPFSVVHGMLFVVMFSAVPFSA